MRKIREVLRLKFDLKLSDRQIAVSCGLCGATVGKYLRRARDAGVSWPLPEGLDDLMLEARLFSQTRAGDTPVRPLPDWNEVHLELKRKGVTLTLLWQEYLKQHPEGYSYSNFGHYYSVPYRHVGQTVDLRLTQHTVEAFLHSARIASHRRAPDILASKGRHTTASEHMPKSHQRYGDWSPQRMIAWAQKTGEHTARVVEEILASRPHPELGFRSCLGLMRLGKDYGPERLELACRRACYYRAFSFKSVQSILQNNLDGESLPGAPETPEVVSPPSHANLRGAAYYARKAN